MPGFEPWDIVRVPFPYTSGSAAPAGGAALLWVLMITSAANRAWPGDVAIGAGGDTGLPAESVVRTAKIATIEQAVAGKVGVVSDGAARERVVAALTKTLQAAVVTA